MKITIDTKALAKAIAQVSRAIATRPTSPILANILIVAEGDQVQLTGYDLATGIRSTIPADVQKSGAIAVPAKFFQDIVNSLEDDVIEIEVNGWDVTIKASGNYQILGLDPSGYPELPTVESGDSIVLSSEAIEAIASVLPFVSKDETRAIITGAHLNIGDGSLEVAATDGHRAGVASCQIESGVLIDMTVPADALDDITKLAKGKGLELAFDSAHVLAQVDGTTIISRVLDGQYPNYPQLYPQSFFGEVVMGRKNLLKILERIAIVASQKNNVVILSLSKDFLSVSSEAEAVGKASESLAVGYSGESIKIAFNAAYLLGGLKAMPGDEILFQFNSPTSPVVIKPLSGPKLNYLVMPVQVRV